MKFELFRRYGILAAAGDRHLCEFVPGFISSPENTNINTENRGQVSNLPLGAVVETNAYLSRDSVQPVTAGRFRRGCTRLPPYTSQTRSRS